MPSRSLLIVSLGAALFALAGCNCGPGYGDELPDGGRGGGSGGSGGGNGGGGSGGNGGGSGGGGGGGGDFNPDASCAAVTTQASLGKKPVDIITVIDNSASMTAEIVGVEQNINANFAQILGDGGLDYRVILLAKHGKADAGQSICITPPLSGNPTCEPPPAKPVNGPRFFHYDTEVASTDSYRKILNTYAVADPSGAAPGGWKQWLRSDAFKVFLEITDDNESTSAANFDSQLLAKDPAMFGTAANRNYLLHAIVGVPQKANPADPYLPNEPRQTTRAACKTGPTAGQTTDVNTGLNYQDLSILTGGLRFPLCDPTKFDTVFRKIAEGVVAGAQVACEFTIPPPPSGWSLSNRIVVQYTPGGGGPMQSFRQVAANACAADAFYTANGRVVLCPATCSLVKADTAAKVAVLFTCEPSGIN